MKRAATIAGAKHQAAMTSHVLRIIFDDLAHINDTVDFGGGDHSILPRHLPDSVRKKQDSFRGCLPNISEDVYFIGHTTNVRLPPQ